MKTTASTFLLSILVIALTFSGCGNNSEVLTNIISLDDFKIGDGISKVSPDLWDLGLNASGGLVDQLPGVSESVIKIEDDEKTSTDLLFKPKCLNSEICRISWKFLVKGGRGASVKFLEQRKRSKVNFYLALNDGLGRMIDVQQKGEFRFTYTSDKMMEFVQIINRQEQWLEYWIEGKLIARYEGTAIMKRIKDCYGGINFVGPDSKLISKAKRNFYYLKNIKIDCVRERCRKSQSPNPVCVNGRSFPNPKAATCAGYTKQEWVAGSCATPVSQQSSVCEIGGRFIDNGLTYQDSIRSTSFPASVLENFNCGSTPFNPEPSTFFNTYIYNHDQTKFSISLQNSGTQLSAYAFRCECRSTAPIDSTAAVPSFCNAVCVSSLQNQQGEITLTENDPSGYYFFVILGNKNTAYKVMTGPPGPCKTEPIPLECGKYVEGTLTEEDPSNFRNCALLIEKGAETSTTCPNDYSSGCYTGNRIYEGADRLFSFEVFGYQKVIIALEGADDLGLFLYAYQCGENCLGYIETPSIDPLLVPTMEKTLPPGIYYLILDRNNTTGDSNYRISLACEPDTTASVFCEPAEVEDCELDSSQIHDLALWNLNNTLLAGTQLEAPPSNYEYDFEFFYPDAQGLEQSFGYRRTWPNGTGFKFYRSPPAPVCGYINGKDFIVRIHRTDLTSTTPGNTFLVQPDFLVSTYSPDTKLNFSGGRSVIQNFTDLGICFLTTNPPFLPTVDGAQHTLSIDVVTAGNWMITSNDSWIHFIQNPGNILVSQLTGTGIQSIPIRIDAQSQPSLPRTGSISLSGPCNTCDSLFIEQNDIEILVEN